MKTLIALACAAASAQTPAAHVRTDFHFTANLPYDEAFPLFGAWAERKWAADWQPRFVYPLPPADVEGAVFRVDAGAAHKSVWTLTRFDKAAGRVQYVYVLNDVLLTRIDIAVTRRGEGQSDVAVAYERTALDPAGEEHVRKLAAHDSKAGAEWEKAINDYAGRVKAGRR